MVVDDDNTFSTLLKTVFDLEGHQSVSVSNQADVIPTARQIKPALVLMDIHVADGDTLDALRGLRADEELKAVPIVMTSGMDRSAECLAAGADRFIFKPFRPSELLEMVEDLLQESTAQNNVSD
jgi:DNA-binding response OmpR family regulator